MYSIAKNDQLSCIVRGEKKFDMTRYDRSEWYNIIEDNHDFTLPAFRDFSRRREHLILRRPA